MEFPGTETDRNAERNVERTEGQIQPLFMQNCIELLTHEQDPSLQRTDLQTYPRLRPGPLPLKKRERKPSTRETNMDSALSFISTRRLSLRRSDSPRADEREEVEDDSWFSEGKMSRLGKPLLEGNRGGEKGRRRERERTYLVEESFCLQL